MASRSLGARIVAKRKAAKMTSIATAKRRDPIIIPTGVTSIDAATGIGGFPTGRWVINHGGQSTGKTTLFLHLAATVQQMGGLVVYNDVEQKLDFRYAARIGVDVDELIVNPPEVRTIEGAFSWIEGIVEMARQEDDEAPVVVIWDSMQQSVCASSESRDWEETGYDGEAKAWSRCIRKFTPVLAHSRAIMAMVSQVKMDIGSPQAGAQTIGVGKAPLHAATIVLQWKSVTALGKATAKDTPGSSREGNLAEVITKKNQAAPPLVTVKVPIRFGQGIDRPTDTLLTAKQWGLVETKGAFHSVVADGLASTGKKFQGIAKWRRHFIEHPNELAELHEAVVAKAIAMVEEVRNS